MSTCVGVEAFGENSQRQEGIDERQEAGGRGISGEQGCRVCCHDAVGDPHAAG